MTAPLTVPMPPITCPEWCDDQLEHLRDWEQHVGLFSRDNAIPRTDGTLAVLRAKAPDELAAIWGGPLHQRALVHIQLEANESIDVQLSQSDGDAQPYLYLDAQGAITPAQAREAAEGLLRAAIELERVLA